MTSHGIAFLLGVLVGALLGCGATVLALVAIIFKNDTVI
jgi:hypothetical protein